MAQKHGCSFEVIERDSNGKGTTWLASCKCASKWVGDTYEQVEDSWRRHVHALTGNAPNPLGNQTGRWSA